MKYQSIQLVVGAILFAAALAGVTANLLGQTPAAPSSAVPDTYVPGATPIPEQHPRPLGPRPATLPLAPPAQPENPPPADADPVATRASSTVATSAASFGGGAAGHVGIWLAQKDGKIVISHVSPDSPAAKGGVKEGDILLAIENPPFDVAVSDRSIEDVAKLIRGTPGTEVRLTIHTPGKMESAKVSLKRNVTPVWGMPDPAAMPGPVLPQPAGVPKAFRQAPAALDPKVSPVPTVPKAPGSPYSPNPVLPAGAPAQASNPLQQLPLARAQLAAELSANPGEAVTRYEQLVANFDAQREAAAQAVFGLAEAYRRLKRLPEARVQYARILREFVDFPELARLSQMQLALASTADESLSTAPVPDWRERRDLVVQEIDLVQKQIDRAKELVELGHAPASTVLPLQREMLQLKHQLSRFPKESNEGVGGGIPGANLESGMFGDAFQAPARTDTSTTAPTRR